MALDPTELHALIDMHGPVMRVTLAEVSGSAPREVGAAMIVWADGQAGTIGGGALEFEAARDARARLAKADRSPVLTRHPLGPALGQCCGGAVALICERIDETVLLQIEAAPSWARPFGTKVASLAVTRHMAAIRNGTTQDAALIDGWFIEPVAPPKRALWIWGAGHVGRAIVSVMAPLTDWDITWVDTTRDRFPDKTLRGVTMLPAAKPDLLVSRAPDTAHHLILTYSHALDLELCHQLLTHNFGWAGLIGSKSKWARFRSRLGQLGHSPDQISRITCPIGDPGLGKQPQAIAIGVAACMMAQPGVAKTKTGTV